MTKSLTLNLFIFFWLIDLAAAHAEPQTAQVQVFFSERLGPMQMGRMALGQAGFRKNQCGPTGPRRSARCDLKSSGFLSRNILISSPRKDNIILELWIAPSKRFSKLVPARSCAFVSNRR